MNNNSTSLSRRRGVGFMGLLTLVFITLKLTHVITWSWIWVLAPLWINFVIIIGIVILIALANTR